MLHEVLQEQMIQQYRTSSSSAENHRIAFNHQSWVKDKYYNSCQNYHWHLQSSLNFKFWSTQSVKETMHHLKTSDELQIEPQIRIGQILRMRGTGETFIWIAKLHREPNAAASLIRTEILTNEAAEYWTTQKTSIVTSSLEVRENS